MEIQTHILCSHCEKILVEVPKGKSKFETVSDLRVGTLENKIECLAEEPSVSRCDEDKISVSNCEINIDYGKSENSVSVFKSGGEINTTAIDPESGLADTTRRKPDSALNKIRKIIVYATMERNYSTVVILWYNQGEI